MEGWGKYHDRWLDPRDEEPRDCDNPKCMDGVINGTDANGSEISDRCPSEIHWTAEERQQIQDDATYDQMRDGMLEANGDN